MTAYRELGELDVYEIAQLAGDLPRTVDTALVVLVQTGQVRVHSPGQLATVDPARRHPVEAAVLDAIGPSGHRSVEAVHWRVAGDERLLEVGRRLRADGLIGPLAPVPLPRHSPLRLVPTYLGRRVLRELRTAPPADSVAAGTCAMAVALGGREAMADAALGSAIFEQPRSAVADGRQPAERTRSRVAADALRSGPR